MKLNNYIPFVAFTSLATAVPASFSISVDVNGGSLSDSLHRRPDICTRICAFEQIQCGQGQYAWQNGECWFCCICSAAPRQSKGEEEKFAASLATQGNRDIDQYHLENMPLLHKDPVGICMAICSFGPMKCPKGWYSHKAGDCWTCCSCTSAPWKSTPETGNELPAGTNAKIELLAAEL